MKTLMVTEARTNLSAVLNRVCQGEDIGMVAGRQIIQLRPVGAGSFGCTDRLIGIL